jgi:hypothetical protein
MFPFTPHTTLRPTALGRFLFRIEVWHGAKKSSSAFLEYLCLNEYRVEYSTRVSAVVEFHR